MGSRNKFAAAMMWFAAAALCVLLIGGTAAVIKHQTDTPVDASEKKQQPVVEVGAHDAEPPVIQGGAGTWDELFQKVGNNRQYWSCFQQRTGYTPADALTALAREREGWKVSVLIVSNTNRDAAKQAMDSKGVPINPDLPVQEMHGFSNTRGAGEGNCQAFDDQRAQARVALTMPGATPDQPGTAVVLAHCGNPIGKPSTPVAVTPPLQPTPPGHGKPTPPPGPKPPTPPGPTPTTTPPFNKDAYCRMRQAQGPYCGDPMDPHPLDPVHSNPQPSTPGAGNPETVIPAQPVNPSSTPGPTTPYGTNTGGGQVGPTNNYSGTGASNPTPGTNGGVTNDATGSAATSNNGGVGQTTNTMLPQPG